ncbi:MAG TPA: glycosyltransferase family 2 protein [Caldilinea sp.]|nr:glycosyltransferase family 2 protein [Caldilinea sp.]
MTQHEADSASAASVASAAAERDRRAGPDQLPGQRPGNGQLCCIVPSFNYGRFIERALDSILAQSRPADEVIVIDDGSTDDTLARLRAYAGRVRVVQNRRNLGLSATRNRAIMLTNAEYVVSIDADDWIEPTYFEVLTQALDEDPALGVVYSGVKVFMNDAGEFWNRPMTWPPAFNWNWMAQRANPPRTTIPASAMYRREMWRRCGGFMETYTRGEDAEFWLRGLATGWGVRKVTEDALYIWRNHGVNLSRTGPFTDVHAWLPFLWRKDAPAGAPAPIERQVQHDYTHPAISVIVTIGPGHGKYATSAIESVVGQTFWNWELVVVNDSGEALDLSRYPFATAIDIGRGNGASKARNAGLKAAGAPFIVFLDGDDFLHPFALQRMAEVYTQIGSGYVYPALFEYFTEADDLRKATARARQLNKADPNSLTMQCGITTLMQRSDAERIGGFDETMLDGWEDYDFYLRLRLAGVCATYLSEPLFYYRQRSGTLRAKSDQHRAALEALIDERYGAYRRGEKTMATCCGGDSTSAAAIVELRRSLEGLPPAPHAMTTIEGKVKMQFIGSAAGGVLWFGKYYAGNNDTDRFIDADPGDVDKLANTGMFQRVEVTTVVEPAAMPIVAVEPPVDLYPFEQDPPAVITDKTMGELAEIVGDLPAVDVASEALTANVPSAANAASAAKRPGRKGKRGDA